jgi:hypothetical protein
MKAGVTSTTRLGRKVKPNPDLEQELAEHILTLAGLFLGGGTIYRDSSPCTLFRRKKQLFFSELNIYILDETGISTVPSPPQKNKGVF